MPFGKNVKSVRLDKNLSLQELANYSGVSVSMLSRIEREEKTPTIRVASQIAKALRMPIGYLLDENFRTSISIVKKDQRQHHIDPMTGIESFLVSPLVDPNIEILSIELSPGSSTGLIPSQSRGVKEYLIILKGRITAKINEGTYNLNEGDCILFDANVPREIVNNDSEPARYYLIADRYGRKIQSLPYQISETN